MSTDISASSNIGSSPNSVGVGQSGKSGGDASGAGVSNAHGLAGGGGPTGGASIGFGGGTNAAALGGVGGAAGADSFAGGAHAGDATDNTSIGSININS